MIGFNDSEGVPGIDLFLFLFLLLLLLTLIFLLDLMFLIELFASSIKLSNSNVFTIGFS